MMKNNKHNLIPKITISLILLSLLSTSCSTLNRKKKKYDNEKVPLFYASKNDLNECIKWSEVYSNSNDGSTFMNIRILDAIIAPFVLTTRVIDIPISLGGDILLMPYDIHNSIQNQKDIDYTEKILKDQNFNSIKFQTYKKHLSYITMVNIKEKIINKKLLNTTFGYNYINLLKKCLDHNIIFPECFIQSTCYDFVQIKDANSANLLLIFKIISEIKKKQKTQPLFDYTYWSLKTLEKHKNVTPELKEKIKLQFKK